MTDSFGYGKASPSASCGQILELEANAGRGSPVTIASDVSLRKPTAVRAKEPGLRALRRLDLAAEIYHIREPQKIPLVMSQDETRLANKDRFDRRLHVVVDAAPADPAIPGIVCRY
jgi:hypothetical protein